MRWRTPPSSLQPCNAPALRDSGAADAGHVHADSTGNVASLYISANDPGYSELGASPSFICAVINADTRYSSSYTLNATAILAATQLAQYQQQALTAIYSSCAPLRSPASAHAQLPGTARPRRGIAHLPSRVTAMLTVCPAPLQAAAQQQPTGCA